MSQDIKNACNQKYTQLLELLEDRAPMGEIHAKIIDVAESLIALGQVSVSDRFQANKKAKLLIGLARNITKNSSHEDIYFKFTGSKLPEKVIKNTELEDLTKELEALKNSDFDNEKGGNIVPPFVPPVIKDAKAQSDYYKKKDDTIRPQLLDDYFGQDKIKSQLKEAIAAAKLKGQPLEHTLFFGSAGLGKTSLAKIIANEMHSNILIMSGPTIKDPLSLVEVIENVQEGDIVFIDEIHRINPMAAEAIYTVMEDFELSYIKKDKNGSNNVTLHLPPFTIIGATTHSGLLEKPMRDRFTLQFKLDLYENSDLTKIALSTMKKLGKEITEDGALSVAMRSRGVPRNLNSFVKRIYDRALVRKVDLIDKEFVENYFDENGIDINGLNETDIEYLRTINDKFDNHPVGIDNLSSCLGEGKNIIENQIEPHLLYLGLINITRGGRILTESGIKYLENSNGTAPVINVAPTKNVNTEKNNESYDEDDTLFNEKDCDGNKIYELIENCNSDEDYIGVASMIYSNIEENLKTNFRVSHNDHQFTMTMDQYFQIAQSVKVDDKFILQYYDKEKGQLRVVSPKIISYNNVGFPEIVEMPPVVRFITAGLSNKDAVKAGQYWKIINKIRHVTPENTDYINNYLKEKAISKKDFIKEAFDFYMAKGMYNK